MDEEALRPNEGAVATSTVAVVGRYVVTLLLYGARGESVVNCLVVGENARRSKENRRLGMVAVPIKGRASPPSSSFFFLFFLFFMKLDPLYTHLPVF